MIYRFEKLTKILICALLLIVTLSNHSAAQTTSGKETNWMRHVKFGIMVHYLSFLQNGAEPHDMGKITSWDSCVNDFDVNLFATQLHEIHAGYLIFTLYQGSRFICTPNAYFEKMTGYARGQATSHRDLIMNLSNALKTYNIKLILYVTGDGTWKDTKSNTVFKNPMLQLKQNGNNFVATNSWVNNWIPVLKEWSLRYKTRVAGWWVDGAYKNHGFTDSLLSKFSKVLKAGNPHAIISFNNAVNPTITYYTKLDDYTAGEMTEFRDVPPAGGTVQGKQWHILSFLGTNWWDPVVKYKPDYLADYINRVNAKGGVVTIDCAVYRDGSIAPAHLSFLKTISGNIASR